MKLSHLRQIVAYLQKYKKISAVYRVSDTIIKIALDKESVFYFDMRRSNSKIFKCASFARSKIYNAPFDILLAKRLNRADILCIELVNDDKIMRFKTSLASAYKEQITYLQFEFTGKYTNAILLDEKGVVLEALRHVDLFSSFREVRVGQRLLDVPKISYKAKEYPLEDVERFLYDTYTEEMQEKLSSLKKQKIAFLKKKLQKLEKLYAQLDDEKMLKEEAEKLRNFGNLLLANIQTIKPYQRVVEVDDYDGKKVKIDLHKEFSSVAKMADSLFTRSKKTKQKASHLHIERDSLKSKIQHIKFFIHTVQEAKDIAKIRLLFPKNIQAKKRKVNDAIETFWVEGYKVSLGKNEKGNVELLQNARAKDIWLHMKARPSAHVIITTDKQNVPHGVIEEAAKLCVDFSVFQKDRYLVDYTPRREVSIQNGANVLYNKYKTVEVDTR